MITTDRDSLQAEYKEKGYTVLRGLFAPEEVASWQRECDRLLGADWVEPKNLRTPFRMNSGAMPERIDPVVDMSPLFQKLVADTRMTDPISALLSDKAVLFKDKLILKLPGTDGYQMHQDWAWGWQDLCPANAILSASIQIDGADPENGGIELFSGYHDKLLTPAGMKTNFRPEEMGLIDPKRGEKMKTEPGDVLVFHALTPHQSGTNRADRPRRSLYLTYNAARVGDLKDDYYEAQFARLKEKEGKEGVYYR